MAIDYGKIAYLKTCDLEIEVNRQQSLLKKEPAFANILQTNMQNVGDFFSETLTLICSEEAYAKISFLIDMEVAQDTISKIVAKMNNQKLEIIDYSLKSGKNHIAFDVEVPKFLQRINSICLEVELPSSCVATIDILQIFAFGEKFDSTENVPKCSFVNLSGYALIFLENGENIDVYKQSYGNPLFELKYDSFEKISNKYAFAVMTAGGVERLSYYYLDEQNKLWLKEYDYVFKTFNTPHNLLSNVSEFSVCKTNLGQNLCYIYNNKVLFRRVTFVGSTYVFSNSQLLYFFTSKPVEVATYFCGQEEFVFAINSQNALYMKVGNGDAVKIGEGKSPFVIEENYVRKIYFVDEKNLYCCIYQGGQINSTPVVASGDAMHNFGGNSILQKNKRFVELN